MSLFLLRSHPLLPTRNCSQIQLFKSEGEIEKLDGHRNEDSSSSAEIAPFSSSANSVHLTRPTTSSDGQKMDQVSLTLKGPSRTRNHKIQAFKL